MKGLIFMKKLLSALLAAAMMLSALPAFAATDTTEMQNALIKVKSRVDVPEELTEFKSGTTEMADGSSQYIFSWTNKDQSESMNVQCDNYGNITNYGYDKDGMYDYGDGGKLSEKTREEYFKYAEEFMKKLAPELFEFPNNTLKATNADKSVVRYASCSFNWEREKDGIAVPEDTAFANVRYDGSRFVVTDAYINWQYDTEFIENYDKVLEDPQKAYLDKFPIELVYTPDWDTYYKISSLDKKVTPKLIYRFKNNDMGYILCENGEIVTPAENADVIPYLEKGAASNRASAMESAEGADMLTEQEISELDKISGLYSAEEILKNAAKTGVFKSLPSADKFYKTLIKTENGYFMRMHYSEEDAYISLSADAETGKLTSFNYSEYSKDRVLKDEYTDKEYDAASKAVDKFLNDNYKQELSEYVLESETKSYGYSRSYVRLVNGIKYTQDTIYVSYSMNGYIDAFSMRRTKDTSNFPDPSGAISAEEAAKAMFEYAPIRQLYVKSDEDKMFRLCYAPSKDYAFEIDALTGKPEDDSRFDDTSYEYGDISGHWAEGAIKALSEAGIGFDGGSFNPDSAIAQKDLLRLFQTAMNYRIDDTDDLYKVAIRNGYISESEKNPDAAVKREDAFAIMTAYMGFGKIASMNDIFKAGFEDSEYISPNRIGAVSILRGYGIVTGNGSDVRPQDSLTRAEAASMLYKFLLTGK